MKSSAGQSQPQHSNHTKAHSSSLATAQPHSSPCKYCSTSVLSMHILLNLTTVQPEAQLHFSSCLLLKLIPDFPTAQPHSCPCPLLNINHYSPCLLPNLILSMPSFYPHSSPCLVLNLIFFPCLLLNLFKSMLTASLIPVDANCANSI